MAITKLPPGIDFKLEADNEHRRAELQRLTEGQESCGCDICQTVYKQLDLKKFGSRVIRVGEVVLIKVKNKKVAEKILEAAPIPLTDYETHQNKKIRVAKVVTVHPHTDKIKPDTKKVFMQHGITTTKKKGRPEKRGKVHRVTHWRRGKRLRVLV